MNDYILCENNEKAFVGDTIKVNGSPERFFQDETLEITGTIREIGWFEDDENDEYYGFILEDSNKFYLTNCTRIELIKHK